MREIDIEVLPKEILSQKIEITGFSASVRNLHLIEPMKLPFGLVESRPSGILELKQKVGSTEEIGYAEGATLDQPVFTDDSGETIAQAVSLIVDDLIKKGSRSLMDTVIDIQNFNFNNNKKYPTAKMMVEMAILDGFTKARNISVKDLLEVPSNIISVPYGKSIGQGNFNSTVKACIEAKAEGAKKIKLKVTPDTTENVLKVINQIKIFGDFEIMVDANGTFDSENDEHIKLLKKLDSSGLIMIEEPCSRIGRIKGIKSIELMRLKHNFQTPICLDDCLNSKDITVYAINSDLADIVNIKPGRIGSIFTSIAIAKLCKKNRKGIMVGGMLEATPGRCMTATLAALFRSMGFMTPGDLSLPEERLNEDLVSNKYRLKYNNFGELVLPTDIGWGFGKITN